MKDVWFISHYSMPPALEQRVKTLKYAELMKERGYKTKIFSASTIHNTEIDLIEGNEKYIEKSYGALDYVHIKVPHYQGNGISRIMNLRKFSKSFATVAKNFNKPDIIVVDANCVNYKWVYKFCKKKNIKIFADIRDLWPLSIAEYLGFSNSNPIIQYLYGQEKKMYQMSDGIIFSMEGGKQYIIDKGWDKKIDLSKVHYINNGVDIESFEKNKHEFAFDDSDLDNPNTFKVVYCGAIRIANNIELLIDVAKKFGNNSCIEFIMYGHGDDIVTFKQRCKVENITNVVFKGQVNKQFIPYILSKSNLNVLNYKNVNAWKYGGSQNKMFEYMASGKPILSTIKMGYSLIEKYNCGVELEQQTVQDTYEAINKIAKLPLTEYDTMCTNAKSGAKNFDFQVLTQQLIDVIDR